MRSSRFCLLLLGLLLASPGAASPRLAAGGIADAPLFGAHAMVEVGDRVIAAGDATVGPGLAVYRRTGIGLLALESSVGPRELRDLWPLAALAASPDGRYVHLLAGRGLLDPRILTFEIEDGGRLVLLGEFAAGDLFADPQHLLVSPDGRQLYATGEAGIAVYEVSGGRFFQLRQMLYGARASRLLLSPDGLSLYATGGSSALASYRRNAADGTLTAVDAYDDLPLFGMSVTSGRDLAQSPDGKYVYLLAHGESLNPPGAIDAVLVFENTGGASLAPRSRGPGTASPMFSLRLAVNDRNGTLYLASYDHEHGLARLAAFPAREGGRDFFGLSASYDADIYSSAGELVAAAGGEDLYLGGFGAVAVEAFRVAGFPGVLERARVPGHTGPFGLFEMTDFAISPSGARVAMVGPAGYIGIAQWDGAARFLNGTRLAGQPALDRVFFVDETRFAGLFTLPSGERGLRLFELSAEGVVVPRGAAWPVEGSWQIYPSPDRRHLFLPGGSGVLHFEYRADGTLVPRGRVTGLSTLGPLRFSPDGRQLLVLANELGLFVPQYRTLIFRFDPHSGQLAAESEDPNLASGALDYAFSPDGADLYVLKNGPDLDDLRVQALRRGADGSFGLLAQQLILPSPAASIYEPGQLALDASGRRLAVLGRADGDLFHLEREPSSGLLTLVETREAVLTLPSPFQVQPGTVEAKIAFGPGGNDFWLLDGGASRLEASRWGCDREAAGELCLGEGGRFRVEADWFTGEDRGAGFRVEAPSADSGLFYFFEPDNWEMLVKVLDGCALNGHYWFFAAATTDVGYALRVTDTMTGRSAVYRNGLGTASPAITDSQALAVCPPPAASGEPPAAEAAEPAALGGDPELLLLRDRFELKAGWRTATAAGAARVAPFGAADSGIFYFFSGDNWEMLVKVLDGCAINGHYWLLAAASTDVGFTLEVKDRQSGLPGKTYDHPGGFAAPAILDLEALGCAPAAAGAQERSWPVAAGL